MSFQNQLSYPLKGPMFIMFHMFRAKPYPLWRLRQMTRSGIFACSIRTSKLWSKSLVRKSGGFTHRNRYLKLGNVRCFILILMVFGQMRQVMAGLFA